MSDTSGYPAFLCNLLDNPPSAGQGVHPWLFRVARYLHRYHTPEEICAILKEKLTDCGRELEPHEIPDAVRNSGACKWEPSDKTPSERRAEWLASPGITRVPKFNPDLALETAARVGEDITPGWLRDHSPRQVASCSTTNFLTELFLAGEKVAVFDRYKSQGSALWSAGMDLEWFTRQHWSEGAWFLCNPVDGQYHWNPRMQKESRRSEESITSFRYAVLECDQGPKEKWFPVWLKILVRLELPIVSITDSAGKSAHALVRVAQESKAAWDQFKRAKLRPLVPLGADDGALSSVRLTRLPGAYRGDRRQQLLYFNPAADGSPIL